jgi:hypothetical protein
VGENTLQIVVKAENGVTATYTVIVTREAAETQQPAAEEEPEQASSETQENDVLDESIVINNVSYNISGSFAAETIPYDFSETTVLYHDTECRGLIYDHGTQLLIYLVQEDAAADGEKTGQFFVYDEIRDTFYPFVRLEGGFGYTIALLAPVDTQLSDTYVQTNLSVGESSISAYQVSDEFYLFYGINQEGEEGWYQYDSKEGTYQRMNTALSVTESEADETDTAADEEDEDEALQYLQQEYNSLTEAYAKEKSTSRNIIAILIFVMVILVFVLINILIRRGKEDDTEEIKQFSRSRSEDELEDKEEDIEEEQDNSEENETRETKGKEKSEKKDGIDVIDFNDF